MPVVMLLLVLAASFYFLIRGADFLVEGASGMAYRLGLPKVVIGATIVSLGTTTPEMAVSVLAAWSGNSGLALGNAVGSIIADTALIFGLGCCLAVLPADRFILSRQGWLQFGSAALLAGFCYFKFFLDGEDAFIGRPIGGILLGLLVLYMIVSVYWSKERTGLEQAGSTPAVPNIEPTQANNTSTEPAAQTADEEDEIEHAAKRSVFLLFGLFLFGLALVLASSPFLVNSASVLAVRAGVPQVVIAATLIALGTSLPELATAIASIIKGHKEILVGNVIGADILNVLFVIGAAAVAAELPIIDTNAETPAAQYIFITLHLPAMMVILLLFRVFVFRASAKGHFSRWMGVPLLALYVAFVALNWIVAGEPPKH